MPICRVHTAVPVCLFQITATSDTTAATASMILVKVTAKNAEIYGAIVKAQLALGTVGRNSTDMGKKGGRRHVEAPGP